MELIVIAMAGALLVVVGIAAYAILLYNSLVRLRHGVDQAWANVDVLLKQRRAEIGSLLAADFPWRPERESLRSPGRAGGRSALTESSTSGRMAPARGRGSA